MLHGRVEAEWKVFLNDWHVCVVLYYVMMCYGILRWEGGVFCC